MVEYKCYMCIVCGFIYNEEEGWPDEGVAPGTRWEDVPETWQCPDCGRTDHIFGEGGVEKEAKKRGLELLAEMPIAMSIRKGADSGLPVVVSEPDSDFAKIYQKLARKVIQKAQLDHGMTMGEKK